LPIRKPGGSLGNTNVTLSVAPKGQNDSAGIQYEQDAAGIEEVKQMLLIHARSAILDHTPGSVKPEHMDTKLRSLLQSVTLSEDGTYITMLIPDGGHFEIKVGDSIVIKVDENGINIGGSSSPSANADITLQNGTMCIAETTTPTADADFGKVYTKADNKLYFQDGAGTEHEIAFV